MKLFKRITCFLAASVMAVTALTGCGSKDEFKLSVDGKDVPIPYVVKFEGEEIPFAHFRYYFLTFKKQIEASQPNIWDVDKEAEDKLTTLSLENVVNDVLVQKLCKENKISLAEEEKTLIDHTIESAVQSAGSKEAFEKMLAEQFLTKDLYRELIETEYLRDKLKNHFFENEMTEEQKAEISKEIHTNFICASHILLEDGQDKLAQELSARAKAGEDFNALVKQYGKDPGMNGNTDGYYFREGEMVDEFYQGAKALKEGEISDPVKSQFGFHIIKRMPLNEDYIKAHEKELFGKTDSFSKFYDQYLSDHWEKEDVETHKNFSKISVKSVK